MMHVRQARIEDAPRILEIRNSPQSRLGSLNWKNLVYNDRLKWFGRKYFESKKNKCFVMEQDNLVIGYCRFDLRDDHFITSIAIDPEYYGEGLGTLLLSDSLNQLDSNRPILTTIRRNNPVLTKIFLRNGYRHIATDELYLYFARSKNIKDLVQDSILSPPLPHVLRIEPASSCNFRCIHCPTGMGMNKNTGIMNKDIFDAIFEKIKKYRFGVIVLYHGGEPLLNKNLFGMVEKLGSITGKLVITTNGSLITERMARKIIDSKIDIIKISLDGNSPEENNKIRVNSNFDIVVNNVKRLIRLKRELGSDKPRIYIANTQIVQEEKCPQTDLSTPSHLKKAFVDYIEDLEFMITHSIVWVNQLEGLIKDRPTYNYCDHIINTITIRHNGEIVPCCYDIVSAMKMGDILMEDLETIWNNRNYQNLREAIACFNPPETCRNCDEIYPSRKLLAHEIGIKP